MAFQPKSTLIADSYTALGGVNKKTGKPNPKAIEGFYLGSKQVDSDLSRTGKAWHHFFKNSSGTVGVYGKTDLDRRLDTKDVGYLLRVTCTGSTPIKGKNDMYTFSVDIDPDQRMDSASLPSLSDDAYEQPAADDEPSGIEDDVDMPPPARSTAPTNPARTPSLADQERVNAILNSRRK